MYVRPRVGGHAYGPWASLYLGEHMFDKTISSTTALAMLLWPAGFLLIILDLMTGWEAGELGLFLAGAAGVLNIRGFFCDLRYREREAYEIGRDSVRSLR